MTEEPISKSELGNHLLGACDILRGPINQDEYKSYITPLLFFKRISDVYDEEAAEALEMSGGDKDYAALPENHSFAVPDGCHWQDVRNTGANVGKAIVDAMVGIERANPDTLSGLFSSFDDASWTDKGKLSDERLKDLIEHFSAKKFGNSSYNADMMGDAYEYLIKKFADMQKKNAGEFYTPREIVKMMVSLLEPKPGETVYDPACGTGGMLIEAVRQMDNSRLAYGKLYGQEKNLSTSAIARMNLYLHGAKDFRITQGDTLRDPAFLAGNALRTFDCVLANPPFSLKNWGSAEFSSDPWGRNIWGVPTDKSADFAWVQHMVCSMDEKSGRCAVVLPQGALFHGGKEGAIRKELLKSDKVEAAISLASGVFYSTGVSACVLFLRNDKPPAHRGRVCIIDGTEIFTAQRAQNMISEENAQEMLSLYHSYEPVVEKCAIATLDDIEREGYVLSANNYVERRREEIEPPAETRKRFYDLLRQTRKSEEKLLELLSKGGYVDGE